MASTEQSYTDDRGYFYADLGPALPPTRIDPTPAGGVAPEPAEARPQRRRKPRGPYDALLDSIYRSKTAPVLTVPHEDRSGAPWTHAEAARTGAHRWLRDPATWPASWADGAVMVLDRRGSYPSAMSGVSVSSTLLTRRGSIPHRVQGSAGLYLVAVPGWDRWDFPPPLGHVQEAAELPGHAWLTDPHLELLERRCELIPEIVDSWIGPRVSSLFGRFSTWAQDARDAVRGTDAETGVKVGINTAVQMLYSSRPGGIWRPDWHAAVVAEANCRHWAKAWSAAERGVPIVGLTKVDEVAVIVPADHRRDVAPFPYVAGDSYGQVSIKATVPASEWIESYGRNFG